VQPPPASSPAPESNRSSLVPDCERCCGLCCVAPGFSASADFAIDKEAGEPCPNLRPDFRCAIHQRLRVEGFSGCAVYDCHGAGQKVTQGTFAGQDWRSTPEIAERMFEVFMIMRQLHELLLYLREALKLEPARPLYGEIRSALDELEQVTAQGPEELVAVDVGACRRSVHALLMRVSERMRASGVNPKARTSP
jgi:hypothetical protein